MFESTIPRTRGPGAGQDTDLAAGAEINPWRNRLWIAALAWFVAALLFSVQAYIVSRLAEHPQPWWPSFAYTAAIFSVWAALSLPLVWFAERLERSRPGWPKRLAANAAALVAANFLHVLIFVLVFWPVYGVSNGFTALDTFAGRMFAVNWHTNILFYLILTVPAAVASRRAAPQPLGLASRLPDPMLRVRTKGQVRLIPAADIRWIAAAGNYAELHTPDGTFLADENLARLTATLPADRFARIHRGAIVQLAEVRDIKSLGRGDAQLVLKDGTELRLSRRFRPAIADWLQKTRSR